MPDFNKIDTVHTSAFDTTHIKHASIQQGTIPWKFLLVAGVLVVYGLIVVYSAVSYNENYSFTRQLIGVSMGIIAMLLIQRIDYRQLAGYTTILLIINIVLILSPLLPIIGHEANGSRSWIKLGMTLQTGEFAKITVILLDASVMSRYGARLDDPSEFAKVLGIMLVPFICIMLQPDLGTGLVYLSIAAVTLVVGGAKTRHLLVTLAGFVAVVAAAFVF
ncbi:MAG: FtsW/RodA/SpoVE family cell cycle protein, partial [Eggerthellaceae bacterium]|nr:FtsW/RodA/SpoVE family cell cycle protein [Eggerthellaceae bacterium]